MNNPNANSLFLHPTDPKEIEDVIKYFKPQKAVGPNSISPKILKDYRKQVSEPLSIIVNLSFSLGKFPDLLKQAKVIPIFKKGDKTNCNNYRPISLLSNIGKVFEKLIHQRLYFFLEQNKCIYPQQFGFRNHHSTNQALINN